MFKKVIKKLAPVVMASAVIISGGTLFHSTKAHATVEGGTIREVTIRTDEILKSSSILTPDINDYNVNVKVDMNNASFLDDDYAEAYPKRVNYWLKDSVSGVILTQGTLYYWPGHYEKKSVNYSIAIPTSSIYHGLRLYLEAPEGYGNADGSMTIWN